MGGSLLFFATDSDVVILKADVKALEIALGLKAWRLCSNQIFLF